MALLHTGIHNGYSERLAEGKREHRHLIHIFLPTFTACSCTVLCLVNNQTHHLARWRIVMRNIILAATFINLLLLHTASAQSPLEEVGHYGENIGVVSVDGDWGVINEGTRIRVMNVSDLGDISFRGSVDIATVPAGIQIVDDHAFVAGYTGPFSIVNITNPDSPFVEGSLDWAAWKSGLWVRGAEDYAYVGVCDGFRVIDVRDKSQPTMVRDITGLGSCIRSITGDGGYLYVVSDGDDTRLRIYSIVDPSTPVLIGSAPDTPSSSLGGHRNSVAVFGDTLFLGRSGGTSAFDISDRTTPSYIGRVEPVTVTSENPIDVDRGILHSAHWGRVDFFNLADPNAPVPSGELFSGPNHIVTDIDAFEGHSLAARSFALTLSTPGGNIQTIHEPTPNIGWASTVASNGQYLYLGTAPGIAVFSLSNPVQPSLIRFISTRWSTDLKIVGDYLYNLSPWGYLEVYSLADPTNPTKSVEYPVSGGIDSLKLDVTSNLAVATANNNLHVYTREPNGTLSQVALENLPTDSNATTLWGTSAYTISVGGELRVYDLSVPSSPILSYSVDLFDGSAEPGFNCAAAAIDGILHLIVGRQGYVILDLSNPLQPSELGRFEAFEMEAGEIAIDGDTVYLFTYGWNGRDGVRALDISQPASITQITATRATGLTLRGIILNGFLYVAEERGGLRIRRTIESTSGTGVSGWVIE